MSRIHEALKKAEQERASALAATPAAPLAVAKPPVPPPVSPVAKHEGSVSPALRAQPASEEFLRFDDLWKRCSQPGWLLDAGTSVFAHPDVPAAATEQFRTLRSRLYQIRDKQPLRTLLITSALAAEGKTFIASNLAQTVVRQQEKRVLLIDADLRNPRLHLTLGAPSSPGITDYLKGQAAETAIIQRGLRETLCFIPSGSLVPNPSELLANGRLKVLLDRVTPLFDWVIVDSPPIGPVSDSLLLADLCDGVLVVVRAASTAYDLAQKSCQEFQNKNLIGVVLNRVEKRTSYNAYQYYYQGNGNRKE
ncbi:MAG: CpsD/CapB family tyrosine-protein kinase [Candidatus Acidiferrales bacterium]